MAVYDINDIRLSFRREKDNSRFRYLIECHVFFFNKIVDLMFAFVSMKELLNYKKKTRKFNEK